MSPGASVECPVCTAAVALPCVSEDGRVLHYFHADRIVAAATENAVLAAWRSMSGAYFDAAAQRRAAEERTAPDDKPVAWSGVAVDPLSKEPS